MLAGLSYPLRGPVLSATLGQAVIALVSPTVNNDADVAPGVVTRVREDGLVNIKVHLDEDATLWLNAVTLYDKRPDEETLAEDHPDTPGPGYQRAAWPLVG
jgi:hypothetical protein